MALTWDRMNIMEPDWYEARTPHGPVQLQMTWEEDEWVLCRGNDVIFYTGSAEPEKARNAAEKWIAANPTLPTPEIKAAIGLLKANGYDVFEAVPNINDMDDQTLKIWRTKANAWGQDIHHRQVTLIQQIRDEIDRRELII